MEKFNVLLLTFLFFSQNLGFGFAKTPEEQDSINNIVKIVEDLTNDIKSIVDDISNRLPIVLKNLETNIQDKVTDANIAQIFESTKEEFESIIQDPSITSECTENAEEELEELNKSTVSGINSCVVLAQDKTKHIQPEVMGLMGKSSELAQEMAKQINKCGNSHGTDAVGLSQCLTDKINKIRSTLGQLKDTIEESMNVAENIAEEVATETAQCLKEVQIETEENVEDILHRLKNCNTHEEL